jgi:hypothetical protein
MGKLAMNDRITLVDGSPIRSGYRELKPNGQQQDYLVLSPEERAARGFVRPVRTRYVHKLCGTVTQMAPAIAETYACDPHFYSGTFCIACGRHFTIDQFVWKDTGEQVGS